MKTRKSTYVCGLVITLLVCLGLQMSPATAQAYVKNIYGYSFTYTNSTQLGWINSVYTGYAWGAATRVLSRNYRTSLIPVSFYYNPNDRASGWGGSSISINTAYTSNAQGMGLTLAHETSHCLFAAWTREGYWNSGLRYYNSFLTEALAYFTGNCAYLGGPRYSDSVIKANLKAYQGRTGYIQSWYGSGKYYWDYTHGSTAVNANQMWQGWWQFHALGSALAGGNRTGTNARVTNLLDWLRYYSYGNLASSNGYTALAAFEGAFKNAYGKLGNSGMQYGSWKSTTYLSGDFYRLWQI